MYDDKLGVAKLSFSLSLSLSLCFSFFLWLSLYISLTLSVIFMSEYKNKYSCCLSNRVDLNNLGNLQALRYLPERIIQKIRLNETCDEQTTYKSTIGVVHTFGVSRCSVLGTAYDKKTHAVYQTHCV